MALDTQTRPPLSDTVQQFGATPMAAVLAQQLQAFTAAGALLGGKDVAVCDATAGTFIVTLPGADVVLGKLYFVKETSGANQVTVDAAGAGTIDGAATVVVPARECVILSPISISPTTGLVTWSIIGQTPAAGGDPSAIHVNVAGEILGITLKALPLDADLLVLESVADANAKRRATIGTLPVIHRAIAGEIAAIAAKALPVDADLLLLEDSAAANAKASATIATLPVIHRAVPGEFAAIAAKAVPVNADLLLIEDSAAANAKASVTILSLPVFHRSVAGEIAAVAAKALPVAGDTILINDSAAADAIASATLGTLRPALADDVLQPAADAAVAITGSVGAVQLVVTAAGNIAITNGAGVYAGQEVDLFALSVAGGGSYTLALDVGTLTLNASSESAKVKRNPGNTAWVCVGLFGATIV